MTTVATVEEVTEEELQNAYLVVVDVVSLNDEVTVSAISEISPAPVLALTDSTMGDRNAGLLRSGADLIMGKPFNGDDLLAHCDALHRRALGIHSSQPYTRRYDYDDLVLDYSARTVTVAGLRMHLTPTQHSLVEYLSRHAGAICTHSQISEAVWGTDYEASAAVIRAHIMGTRKALGDSLGTQHYIKTENGVGYWMPRPSD